MSANRLNADIPKWVTRGRLVAEAVEELFLRSERATMNRPVPLLGNKGSRAGYYRLYCCASTLPPRVLQQPQPTRDISDYRRAPNFGT